MAPGVPKTNGYAETRRLIHFRSASPEIYPYLRFLEAVIMSHQGVPFKSRQEFDNQIRPWRPRLSRLDPKRAPGPRSTDMTDEGVDKSLEEMDATRKTLYAILDIEDVDDGMESWKILSVVYTSSTKVQRPSECR